MCLLGTDFGNWTFFKKIVFIYLAERESTSRGSSKQREKAGFPLSRGPDVGLDPRTLGS